MTLMIVRHFSLIPTAFMLRLELALESFALRRQLAAIAGDSSSKLIAQNVELEEL